MKISLIALKDYSFKQATLIGGGGDILKYPSSIFRDFFLKQKNEENQVN